MLIRRSFRRCDTTFGFRCCLISTFLQQNHFLVTPCQQTHHPPAERFLLCWWPVPADVLVNVTRSRGPSCFQLLRGNVGTWGIVGRGEQGLGGLRVGGSSSSDSCSLRPQLTLIDMIVYGALKASNFYAVRWSRVLRPLLLVNVTEGRQVRTREKCTHVS